MPKAKPIPASSHALGDGRVGKGLGGEHGAESRPNATEVVSSVEPPDWKKTPIGQRIAILKDLSQQGLTCAVIASRFQNCTRNAVIGMLRRIEEKEGPLKRNHVSRPLPAPPQVSGKGKGKAANNAAYNIQMKVQQRAQEARPDQKPAQDVVAYQNLMAKRREAFLPLPGVKPVALINIPLHGRCRWPVDVEAPGHFFCGDAARTESVWCAAHHRLATQSRANTKELIDG